jgi:hypothetical protein
MRWVHPRFADRDPLITDQFNWTDLTTLLRERALSDPAKYFIVGHRWQDCIRIDYALQGKVPVVCMTQEPLQLSFFEQQRPVMGRDAVVVSRNWSIAHARRLLGDYFDSIEPMEPVVIGQHGLPTMKLNLFVARNFKKTYPWPYGAGLAARPPADPRGRAPRRKTDVNN